MLLAPITPRRRSGARHDVAPCGTVSGHRRHLRLGEDSCLDCRRSLRRGQDRVEFETAVARGVMVARPELADFPSFGATHYPGLVMGA